MDKEAIICQYCSVKYKQYIKGDDESFLDEIIKSKIIPLIELDSEVGADQWAKYELFGMNKLPQVKLRKKLLKDLNKALYNRYSRDILLNQLKQAKSHGE